MAANMPGGCTFIASATKNNSTPGQSHAKRPRRRDRSCRVRRAVATLQHDRQRDQGNHACGGGKDRRHQGGCDRQVAGDTRHEPLDAGQKIMVGVNKYVTEEEIPIPLLEIDDKVEEDQIARLSAVRRKRDNKALKRSLEDIKNACKKGENVMPHCIEAVKNLASVQEVCDVYREVYGEYRDPGLY